MTDEAKLRGKIETKFYNFEKKKIENNELPLKIIVLVFSGLPVESSDLSV